MTDENRIRWHCRRGLLELDLVLNAFIDRYLARLEASEIRALHALLQRPDPELLDFIMGQSEPTEATQRDLVGLIRTVNVSAAPPSMTNPSPSRQARADTPAAGAAVPLASN